LSLASSANKSNKYITIITTTMVVQQVIFSGHILVPQMWTHKNYWNMIFIG